MYGIIRYVSTYVIVGSDIKEMATELFALQNTP